MTFGSWPCAPGTQHGRGGITASRCLAAFAPRPNRKEGGRLSLGQAAFHWHLGARSEWGSPQLGRRAWGMGTSRSRVRRDSSLTKKQERGFDSYTIRVGGARGVFESGAHEVLRQGCAAYCVPAPLSPAPCAQDSWRTGRRTRNPPASGRCFRVTLGGFGPHLQVARAIAVLLSAFEVEERRIRRGD